MKVLNGLLAGAAAPRRSHSCAKAQNLASDVCTSTSCRMLDAKDKTWAVANACCGAWLSMGLANMKGLPSPRLPGRQCVTAVRHWCAKATRRADYPAATTKNGTADLRLGLTNPGPPERTPGTPVGLYRHGFAAAQDSPPSPTGNPDSPSAIPGQMA